MDAREIAGRLSDEQRRGLVAGGEMHPDDLFALESHGVLYRDRPRDTHEHYAFNPTPLGLQVRSLLPGDQP
jgi:hypothetical protein